MRAGGFSGRVGVVSWSPELNVLRGRIAFFCIGVANTFASIRGTFLSGPLLLDCSGSEAEDPSFFCNNNFN